MSLDKPNTLSQSKADDSVRDRINILRYLMIFGIIMLHTPQFVPLVETGSTVFEFVKAVFQHAIFRCSVPVLTCISGYLLFKASLDLKFRELVVKKLRTLVVPLVLFNIPIALLIYVVQAKQLLDHEFSQKLYPFNGASWIDAVFGLYSTSANYPLGFLRDLFVISLLAPLAGLLLRYYAWPGLFITFIVFWFNLDGNLVLRSPMPIVFYVGGMAAICQWDIKKLDKYAPWLLLVFLALSVAVVFFQIENRNYLRLAAPLLIWPAASMLVNTALGMRLGKLAKYSFFTFLIHGPMLLVSWIVYQRAFSTVPYWLYWVGTPVIVAIISIGLHVAGYRIMPNTMNFLLGGREKGRAVKELPEATISLEVAPPAANVSGQGNIRPRRASGLTGLSKGLETPTQSAES